MKEESENRLGTNVKAAREAVGLSQNELAILVGVSTNYISQIENSRKDPSLKTLSKIATSLNIEKSALFGNDALFFEIQRLVHTFGIRSVVSEIQGITDSISQQAGID